MCDYKTTNNKFEETIIDLLIISHCLLDIGDTYDQKK